MKLISEKIPDLESFYFEQLRRLLSAEEMIGIKALAISEDAGGSEIKALVRRHWLDGTAHAERIREILTSATGEAVPIKCKVIYALFDEGEDLAIDAGNDEMRDVGMIAMDRRIRHYELSCYEALLQVAQVLGREEDVKLMEETVREETKALENLSIFAEHINPMAKKTH